MVTTSHSTLPPFPNDVPTAPLVSVSFAKLEVNDASESSSFFTSCKNLGFFYLDMIGSTLGETIVSEAEELNTMQQQFFNLPNEVKDIYGRPKLHPFYAYRFSEEVKEENPISTSPKRVFENYNLRKDDILGQCERLACHPIITEHQNLYERYVKHCRQAVDILLEHLNTHLQLPKGTLANLHRIHERSGDHVRITQSQPTPYDEERAARAEHTDFGSITILFNWLSGLQIRTADTNQWVYVRPIPGSCVVNLGDAMVKFTAGLLRSNVHRVVPPIGEQASHVRNSPVYFTRPEDTVILKRLPGGIIDSQPISAEPEPEYTADQWIMMKGTGQVPGVYTAKGFEHKTFGAKIPLAGVPSYAIKV